MKKIAIFCMAALAPFALVGFTGCEETPADRQADAVRDAGENQADMVEEHGDAIENQGDRIENAHDEAADDIRDNAEDRADAIEEADPQD